MFHSVHTVTNRTRLKTKPHRLSRPTSATPTPPSTLSEDLENPILLHILPLHRVSHGLHAPFNNVVVIHIHLSTARLRRYRAVHNVDGSHNDNGLITEEARLLLRIGDHTESACFAVTSLGRQTVIIGHSWLRLHNPEVDWVSQKVVLSRCPSSCYPVAPSSHSDINSVELEEGDAIYAVSLPANYTQNATHIAVTQTPSQKMAQEAHTPDDRPLPALIPSHSTQSLGSRY